MEGQAQVRCDAEKEPEIQCLRESCKSESKTEQGRAVPEKASGRESSRLTGRAGLEQFQGNVKTD